MIIEPHIHTLRAEVKKSKILVPGTEEGPWLLDDWIDGKAKPIFYVETEQTVYVGNDFNTVMRLWAPYSMTPPIAETIGKRDATTVLLVWTSGLSLP